MSHRTSLSLRRRGVRRLGAGLLVSALALVGTGLASAPAQAARGADPASTWLGDQLDDGLVHNNQFDFDDYGLTADVGIALDAIGGSRAEERAVRKALSRHVDSWTTGVDFGLSDVYAGSVAKAVVLAQAVDADPRDFGGVNLVQRLNRLVTTGGPADGRIGDRTADVDYANTIGQSFAVQGLSEARSGKAGATLKFLLKQQCDRGYFRLSFAPTQRGPQTCDAGTRDQSAPDTDVTALAVLSLDSLERQTPTVRAAVAEGVRWLTRQQKGNGSFGGGPSTAASNTNSTGLAAWALGETGACEQASRAARWVVRLQRSSGAIAYDAAAYEAGKNGIDATERDQWRRATAQAGPGLLYRSKRACA